MRHLLHLNVNVFWVLGVFALVPSLKGAERPPALSQEVAHAGWLLFFDGDTTAGWEVAGTREIVDGVLIVGGKKPSTLTSKIRLGPAVWRWSYQYEGAANVVFEHATRREISPARERRVTETINLETPVSVVIHVPAGGTLKIFDMAVRPEYSISLFDGNSLKGWKKYAGDPKREKSTWTVAPEGWIHVRGGPGDLQTERQFADFFLHVECRTNGPNLNSGIFFRALPGQYQQGYEAQIHHGFVGNRRDQPADFGTGGIYRRQPARRVVANDGEWFVLTIAADDDRILTWVNGMPVCDWRDDRPPHPNPRAGRKTSAGVISIQGHDPTTDLHFRKVQVCPLPPRQAP